MIQSISIDPHKIKEYTPFYATTTSLNSFPFLSMDQDSYLVGVEVQSGINFDVDSGRHCIAIGKCCSLAEAITFMIDVNYDYTSVCQGELYCLQGVSLRSKLPRKGSIILQNDVWIGHGATVMAGVTLHNGCVVAANAVVTKDVPPYAIVGGNPAKILRYRFDEDTVSGLQKIAWWDWDPQLQYQRRNDFALPAPEFVDKYLPEVEKHGNIQQTTPLLAGHSGKTVLLIPDFAEPYPLYPKILERFFNECPSNTVLLIYMPAQVSTKENLDCLGSIFLKYEKCDCDVILQSGEDLDEHILFQSADYYITTRSRETVHRTCLADLYQTKILYGTDEPLFYD